MIWQPVPYSVTLYLAFTYPPAYGAGPTGLYLFRTASTNPVYAVAERPDSSYNLLVYAPSVPP
jgi:hypothetical protein